MIDTFVQGVLTVEDEIYLGEPDLRLATGETIHILYSDLRPRKERIGDDVLGLVLEVGYWYELLLLVQIGLGRDKKVTYTLNIPSETELKLVTTKVQGVPNGFMRTDVVQGMILDPQWDVTSQKYLADAGSLVSRHQFVLIETAIGKMVVSYKALQERLGEQITQVAPGGYLEWEPSRLDLLAILEKRDPHPGE